MSWSIVVCLCVQPPETAPSTSNPPAAAPAKPRAPGASATSKVGSGWLLRMVALTSQGRRVTFFMIAVYCQPVVRKPVGTATAVKRPASSAAKSGGGAKSKPKPAVTKSASPPTQRGPAIPEEGEMPVRRSAIVRRIVLKQNFAGRGN